METEKSYNLPSAAGGSGRPESQEHQSQEIHPPGQAVGQREIQPFSFGSIQVLADGMMPPHTGRAICFIQSAHSDANLF